ncbi:MAG TPA: ThuA domain-containing protein [Anaerolineae bacterium]|nr:ThuA domain-containing protein [Anaerolineae bacterium]
MRTLVVCDDYWHPARTARDGLATLGDCGFEFDWIEDAADWSAERMAEYPLVLFAKSDDVSAADRNQWVTEAVQDAFVDYVRQGNGLLVVHSGTVYARQPVLRGLIGGAFIRHPKQCPVTVEPKDGHPLTTGSMPFTLVDEHYIMELDDPQADVFVTTTSEHGTQPGGWTRVEGEGRVCVLTPGHNVEVWQHPSFQALLVNGMRWCSKTLEQESASQ